VLVASREPRGHRRYRTSTSGVVSDDRRAAQVAHLVRGVERRARWQVQRFPQYDAGSPTCHFLAIDKLLLRGEIPSARGAALTFPRPAFPRCAMPARDIERVAPGACMPAHHLVSPTIRLAFFFSRCIAADLLRECHRECSREASSLLFIAIRQCIVSGARIANLCRRRRAESPWHAAIDQVADSRRTSCRYAELVPEHETMPRGYFRRG